MKKLLVLILISHASLSFAQLSGPVLTLDKAIEVAFAADPWLNGSQHREDALKSESVSLNALPDPKVTMMAGSFPVDTFDINQEGMTQLSVGVTQMFPRGDSRDLSSRQRRELAAQEPLLRQDRMAKVSSTVSQLWLEAFKAQESIRLIEKHRSLFEYLVDATQSSYSSALGRARQQDIIRAQLELTRLDDRLTVLHQQLESAQQRLSEWIGQQARMPLAGALPNQDISQPLSTLKSLRSSDQWIYEQIYRHPVLQAFDQRISAMQTGVELAQQKYKPEWGLSAQYGYRDDDPMGSDRADLFSIGVTFDLPLFTAKRQDKEVSAATSRAEALKTDKLLMARRLMAELDAAIVQLQRLNERHALYDKQLLPQMAEQAEAALAAYNNDDGDFAEAVRARIAELNARIEALAIVVEQHKTSVKINYLLSSSQGAAHTSE
jgi:outer membrane protein TolC